MKKKDTYRYPAILTYGEGQDIVVELPDFDVASCGVDDAEAFQSAFGAYHIRYGARQRGIA